MKNTGLQLEGIYDTNPAKLIFRVKMNCHSWEYKGVPGAGGSRDSGAGDSGEDQFESSVISVRIGAFFCMYNATLPLKV